MSSFEKSSYTSLAGAEYPDSSSELPRTLAQRAQRLGSAICGLFARGSSPLPERSMCPPLSEQLVRDLPHYQEEARLNGSERYAWLAAAIEEAQDKLKQR